MKKRRKINSGKVKKSYQKSQAELQRGIPLRK